MNNQPRPADGLDRTKQRSTLLGIAAILLWSTTIAFSRNLTEQLGTLTAGASIYTIAGGIGLLVTGLKRGELKAMLRLPPLYLYGCGALFAAYIGTFYLAVGLAATHTQVLAVGLINYLWPALSLVFSIPILQRRPKPLLPVGIIVALLGLWFSTTGGVLPDPAAPGDGVTLLPYLLALVAAVCWGLYSNLSRRWAGGGDGGGVPIFLLTSGLLLGLARLFTPEISHWSIQVGIELFYMALFPGMLAYVFWDAAVRRGAIITLAALSYMTPLISTIVSALVLGVQPGAATWIGAGMLIVGAIICKQSIIEPAQAV